ncbi:fatty acid binding protein 1-B.1 [Danio rerio]|uniref:Fatty acid binding protein 1-B.1 n=1 Tax=Danio rerio TaxID=7955 RepID=A0A0R4IRM6_DANRE|nr:fatty acid binding protein 1-B.1 [Danio rerio]|eukprot:XP_002663094.2 fatty acid binding protein 1-B.1 [Danio rerio]
MPFSGKFELEKYEGWEEFMTAIGHQELLKKANDGKTQFEIQENGNDYCLTTRSGGKVLNNSFTIGQDTEIQMLSGDKVKTVVHKDGQKLKAALGNITLTWELLDENTLLITLSTADNVAYKRFSKRVA